MTDTYSLNGHLKIVLICGINRDEINELSSHILKKKQENIYHIYQCRNMTMCQTTLN